MQSVYSFRDKESLMRFYQDKLREATANKTRNVLRSQFYSGEEAAWTVALEALKSLDVERR